MSDIQNKLDLILSEINDLEHQLPTPSVVLDLQNLRSQYEELYWDSVSDDYAKCLKITKLKSLICYIERKHR